MIVLINGPAGVGTEDLPNLHHADLRGVPSTGFGVVAPPLHAADEGADDLAEGNKTSNNVYDRVHKIKKGASGCVSFIVQTFGASSKVM
jgi:hypothetical protein